MLLTVLQVERCHGDDDWSLSYKKFYRVPPCDIEWGSKWNKWQRVIASMLQNGRNTSDELSVDFPCLFACKRQWKWYPLCVRVLWWCMDGKSRILARNLWHGLTGLMSMNERGQLRKLFCMIPLPASSSPQQLIMLGDWSYIFVSVLQSYADRWKRFYWCSVYLFNLCSFHLFPTFFLFSGFMFLALYTFTLAFPLSRCPRSPEPSISLYRWWDSPFCLISSTFTLFSPLFLLFGLVWKTRPHLSGLELSKQRN